MNKKTTNLLNLLMVPQKDIWRDCRDFPEYEISSGFKIRRKGREKALQSFWWDGEECYALRDRTGRFRFVPFYEPWEGVTFIEDKPWYSVGPIDIGQKGFNK